MVKLAIRLLLVLIVAAGAVGGGAYWWTTARFQESTDNAYVEGDISVISPLIEGKVATVQVGVASDLLTPTARAVLATGVIGGFTTYSTFNQETIELLRAGAFALAGLNVTATLVLGLLAGALGLLAGRALVGA